MSERGRLAALEASKIRNPELHQPKTPKPNTMDLLKNALKTGKTTKEIEAKRVEKLIADSKAALNDDQLDPQTKAMYQVIIDKSESFLEALPYLSDEPTNVPLAGVDNN